MVQDIVNWDREDTGFGKVIQSYEEEIELERDHRKAGSEECIQSQTPIQNKDQENETQIKQTEPNQNENPNNEIS